MGIGQRLRSGIKKALRPAALRLTPRRVDLPPRVFGLERDAGGELSLGALRLTDLADRFGSPLFVVDAARLDRNAAAFTRVPPGATGGVECYYSYKTNPVPAVLSRLHARGVGAEVISEYELWLARRLGVPGERIVLNGPGRTLEAFRTAVELGALVQVNHREEIPILAAIARSAGKRCRVGLRIVTSFGWGGQFGEPVQGGVALDCYREMLERPELDVAAVHAHLGGEISSAETVRAFARDVLDFCATLRTELGLTPGIVDLGGSLASRTVVHHSEKALRLNRALGADLVPRPPESVLGIEEYVATAVSEVESRARTEGWPRPRVFVEPGRALTSDTQLLLCRVTGLKASGAPNLTHAILNAGVNVAEAVRGEYHQLYVAGREREGEAQYRLVGPICTPMDTLAWAWRLPRLESGDVLAIMDAGAYFVPFSTSFSFPQPAIAVVENGEATLVRRAESFDDMIRRDTWTG
jgi:diaminopimelate decarboxylase